MATDRNVLGGILKTCSLNPLTGWKRDGCCSTDENDRGLHVICVQATAEFLAFTKSVGNDLSTPVPRFRFPGVQPGERWCLCATRWKEALNAGKAPPVFLEGTHEKALEIVSLEDLLPHAITEASH